MSCLRWNCQGLGNLQVVRDLFWLVKEKKLKLVFLIETKLQSHRFETINLRIGFDSVFVVDYVGKSGGLTLLWKAEIEVDIQNYSCRHINTKIRRDA
jgi:hypothetical protein